MSEAKHFWLPKPLLPQALMARVHTFEGLTGLGKAPLLKPESKPREVFSSLNHYVGNLVASGDFSSLLDKYIREDSHLNPRKFILETHYGNGRGKKGWGEHFYFDGFASLILFYGPPKNVIAVAGSVNMIKDVTQDKQKSTLLDRTTLSDRDLIITQLQGPSNNHQNNKKITETFSRFRWERMLAEIFIDWARQAGLKRIYLLPAAMSYWNKVIDDSNGTAKLRYDVTAKRLGFKRARENVPYLLSAEENNEDLRKIFETIFPLA